MSNEERNALLEQCAKIVEGFVDDYPEVGCCFRHKKRMAAQIRALKEPPELTEAHWTAIRSLAFSTLPNELIGIRLREIVGGVS